MKNGVIEWRKMVRLVTTGVVCHWGPAPPASGCPRNAHWGGKVEQVLVGTESQASVNMIKLWLLSGSLCSNLSLSSFR